MTNRLHTIKISDTASKLILLGEDDIDDQEFLEDAIYKLDASYKLHAISNGKKVVEYLEGLTNDGLPCLIVLDYNMPELNGSDILRVLQNDDRYSPIPKVIWSTSRSPEYKSLCMELGACDYIVKPSNISSLMEVAKHILSFCNSSKLLF